MDYIREELLRQRAVLAWLLLGRTADEAEREEESVAGAEEDFRDSTEQMTGLEEFRASRALAAGEQFRRGRRGLRTAEAERWEVYGALSEELPEAALRRELGDDWAAYAAWTLGEADTVSAARYALRGTGTAGRRYGLPETVDVSRARGDLTAGADNVAPEYRMGQVVRPAAGETTDARELSRVFQRDARRYDGGFTLY